MASGTFYPAASGDDGYWYNWGINTNSLLAFGNEAGEGTIILNTFVRFINVVIPAGATITEAYARFTGSSAQSGTTCNANIYFNDEDDATAPTTKDQANALDLTDAVAWDSVGAWSDGSTYDTPDLSDILQDVIDRAGWASGQDLMVLVKDNSSSSNARREASDYDYSSGSEKPELHVTWTESSEPVSIIPPSLILTGAINSNVRLIEPFIVTPPFVLAGTIHSDVRFVDFQRTQFNGTLSLVNSLQLGGTLSLVNSLNARITGDLSLVLNLLQTLEGTLSLKLNLDERNKISGQLALVYHILDADAGITIGGTTTVVDSYVDPGGYVTTSGIYDAAGDVIIAPGGYVPVNTTIPAGAQVKGGFHFAKSHGL